MSASALKIIKANYEARATKLDELRKIDESAEGRAYTEDEAAEIAEHRSALEAIDGRIQEQIKAEIRSTEITDAMGSLVGLMSRDSGEVVDTRSLGERFANADEVRNWIDGGARGTSPSVTMEGVELRAVTDTTTGATSGGAFINNTRLTRVGADFLDRKVFLADLLPVIPISTGSVEYVQDVSPLADLVNKPAEVTEGAAKPQAGITTAVITEAAATIAAWVNMTRQVAADSPQLQGYIEGRLRYALKRRVDQQLISGNGTPPNLRGLLNRTGINTYVAPATAENAAISIRKALTVMENVEAVPEIIVLNPADAENFDLTNSATAGIHATPDETGGFRQGPSRTAWGMTQVHSTAIASGTALLIDPMAVALFDRQQIATYMTDSHASLFISNVITLLMETRVGLGLFDPKGVLALTFDYVP